VLSHAGASWAPLSSVGLPLWNNLELDWCCALRSEVKVLLEWTVPSWIMVGKVPFVIGHIHVYLYCYAWVVRSFLLYRISLFV